MKRSLAGLFLILSTVGAVVMPVGTAMAAGECKDHFTPIPWAATVDPDRNSNGIVCFKVNGGGSGIIVDDH